MANYNIVLNLSGNAVTRVEKLAAALATANTNATALATRLAAVGGAARAIPANPIRIPYASGAVRVPNVTSHPHVNTGRNYTRHQHTRIASMGTGFHFGPFSGRLSTILQPDENGMLLGMDAAKLMRGVNVAGIATSMVTSIGKTVAKTMAVSTLAPIAIGGGGLMLAMRALQSEGFAEGVRLISRRHQAQLGLGAEFEQAQKNTDYLAAAFGLDRSTALSSINVMTGMGVGQGRRLTLGEATGLTKVGGLISQHHGVPYERVMTNIQQLLVQQTPHMRDIRELLNQAPILGKYALKEMDERGVKNTDVRTYLKDKENIMSVLKSYEMDVATNAGMQARGRIALAQQDAWAKVAGNDPFWRYVGHAGSGVIGSASTAINNLMTTLEKNDSFKVMIKQVEYMFDNLGTKGTTFIDKLIRLVDGLAEKYGLDPGDKGKAKETVDKENALNALVNNPAFRNASIAEYERLGLLKNAGTETSKNKLIEQLLHEDISRYKTSLYALGLVNGVGNLTSTGDPTAAGLGNTRRNRVRANISAVDFAAGLPYNADSTAIYYPVTGNVRGYQSVSSEAWQTEKKKFYEFWKPGKTFSLANPANANARYDADIFSLVKYGSSLRPTVDDELAGRSDSLRPKGEDLTGMNRDRRSLEIHFHAPISEINVGGIQTSDPQQAVDYMFENADVAMSASIQKALLGASNKMAARWY